MLGVCAILVAEILTPARIGKPGCKVLGAGIKSVNTGVLIGNHEDTYIQMVTNNNTGLKVKKKGNRILKIKN